MAVSRVSRTGGNVGYRLCVPVPQWCVDQFGRDLFATAISVTYFEHGAYPPHTPENHRNFEALCDLPEIEEVCIYDSAFPFDVLGDMAKLQRLAIDLNGLRDDDIRFIAKLNSLRTLSLRFNGITDSGAEKLSRLHNLTDLDLTGNPVSDEARNRLQRSLPNCRITNGSSRADSGK